jgi:hypothetical protein
MHVSFCPALLTAAVVILPHGGKPVVPKPVEIELLWYIKHRNLTGAGIDWADVRNTARALVQTMVGQLKETGTNRRLRRDLEKFKATRGWLSRFRERHKDELTDRRHEHFEPARAAACTKEAMERELALRIHAYEEVDRLNGGTGDAGNVKDFMVNNLDESGHEARPKQTRQATVKGKKDCQVTGDKHGPRVTGIYVLNATGTCADPSFILPGARDVRKHLDDDGRLKGVMPKSKHHYTKSGSMTDEVG